MALGEEENGLPKYMEGYLHKKERRRKWIEYWVVLEGKYLKFQRHKLENEDVGNLLIGWIELSKGTKCCMGKTEDNGFPFYIKKKGKRYLFKTACTLSRHRWVKALELAIEGKPANKVPRTLSEVDRNFNDASSAPEKEDEDSAHEKELVEANTSTKLTNPVQDTDPIPGTSRSIETSTSNLKSENDDSASIHNIHAQESSLLSSPKEVIKADSPSTSPGVVVPKEEPDEYKGCEGDQTGNPFETFSSSSAKTVSEEGTEYLKKSFPVSTSVNVAMPKQDGEPESPNTSLANNQSHAIIASSPIVVKELQMSERDEKMASSALISGTHDMSHHSLMSSFSTLSGTFDENVSTLSRDRSKASTIERSHIKRVPCSLSTNEVQISRDRTFSTSSIPHDYQMSGLDGKGVHNLTTTAGNVQVSDKVTCLSPQDYCIEANVDEVFLSPQDYCIEVSVDEVFKCSKEICDRSHTHIRTTPDITTKVSKTNKSFGPSDISCNISSSQTDNVLSVKSKDEGKLVNTSLSGTYNFIDSPEWCETREYLGSKFRKGTAPLSKEKMRKSTVDRSIECSSSSLGRARKHKSKTSDDNNNNNNKNNNNENKENINKNDNRINIKDTTYPSSTLYTFPPSEVNAKRGNVREYTSSAAIRRSSKVDKKSDFFDNGTQVAVDVVKCPTPLRFDDYVAQMEFSPSPYTMLPPPDIHKGVTYSSATLNNINKCNTSSCYHPIGKKLISETKEAIENARPLLGVNYDAYKCKSFSTEDINYLPEENVLVEDSSFCTGSSTSEDKTLFSVADETFLSSKLAARRHINSASLLKAGLSTAYLEASATKPYIENGYSNSSSSTKKIPKSKSSKTQESSTPYYVSKRYSHSDIAKLLLPDTNFPHQQYMRRFPNTTSSATTRQTLLPEDLAMKCLNSNVGTECKSSIKTPSLRERKISSKANGTAEFSTVARTDSIYNTVSSSVGGRIVGKEACVSFDDPNSDSMSRKPLSSSSNRLQSEDKALKSHHSSSNNCSYDFQRYCSSANEWITESEINDNIYTNSYLHHPVNTSHERAKSWSAEKVPTSGGCGSYEAPKSSSGTCIDTSMCVCSSCLPIEDSNATFCNSHRSQMIPCCPGESKNGVTESFNTVLFPQSVECSQEVEFVNGVECNNRVEETNGVEFFNGTAFSNGFEFSNATVPFTAIKTSGSFERGHSSAIHSVHSSLPRKFVTTNTDNTASAAEKNHNSHIKPRPLRKSEPLRKFDIESIFPTASCHKSEERVPFSAEFISTFPGAGQAVEPIRCSFPTTTVNTPKPDPIPFTGNGFTSEKNLDVEYLSSIYSDTSNVSTCSNPTSNVSGHVSNNVSEVSGKRNCNNMEQSELSDILKKILIQGDKFGSMTYLNCDNKRPNVVPEVNMNKRGRHSLNNRLLHNLCLYN